MKIDTIDEFTTYYARVKQRTARLFEHIPEDHLEWTFREGKFTIGDQVRHIANIERYMFASIAQHAQSRYAGCGVEYAQGLENVIAYYHAMSAESLAIFKSLSKEDLLKKCKTPAGMEITCWKWLRAMLEHEIHHRAQVYLYLSMLEVETPPIFGLTSEEVIFNSHS